MVYPRISTSGRNSGFSAFTTTVANNSSKEATKPIKNTSKKTGATEKPKDPPEKYSNLKVGSTLTLNPKSTKDTYIGKILSIEKCQNQIPKSMQVKFTNTPNKGHGIKEKIVLFTYISLKGGNDRIWCWSKVISTVKNKKNIPHYKEWKVAA